ncbi:hypothetical protein LCGC14_1332220 [marine sediment metagenome]|uniref:Uncharacterized protein n=1 Tax=marine sediment metagenome TaxID=412755 RepID=A0A0F9KG41_9ZZZZ
MTVEIFNPRHKLIVEDGMALWMPRSPIASNLFRPNVYEQSVGQEYPLGSCLDYADGRRFRYGKWGETNTSGPIARMVVNGNLVPGSDDVAGYEGSLDALSDFAVGSTTLILNDPEDRVENYYEDGMLSVFPSGHYVEYRIVGNEAASGVDDVTIYLDHRNGLQTALVVNSTGVTAYPSIFNNLISPTNATSGAAYASAMGVCLADTMTSGYFGWVQRKGRCIITPTAYFGDSVNERMAQMHADGTIALKAADATHTVGYLTVMTISGYGDLEVWLTLE